MGSRTKKKGYTAADWDAAGPMLGGASDSGRNSTNESWQLTPPKDGTLPGRGPNGEMPFGSRPGTGKVNQPKDSFDLFPPKDEFPQDGMTQKPGTGQTTQPPYSDTPPLPQLPDDGTGKPGSSWNYFDFWNPGQHYRGVGWNPDYRVTVPQGDPSNPAEKAKTDAANFLNFFNTLVPYLGPSDLGSYAQQVNQALDALDDKTAAEYFRGLARGTSGLGLQGRDLANYYDRDRLREVRAALNQSFGADMGVGQINEMELPVKNVIDLLDMLLGHEATGGGVDSPGIWTDDRPMTRRERQEYWNKANTYLGGVDQNDPFANLIMSILGPTTNTPMLNTYIHAPQRYAPTGSAYTYGYSNPRY